LKVKLGRTIESITRHTFFYKKPSIMISLESRKTIVFTVYNDIRCG